MEPYRRQATTYCPPYRRLKMSHGNHINIVVHEHKCMDSRFKGLEFESYCWYKEQSNLWCPASSESERSYIYGLILRILLALLHSFIGSRYKIILKTWHHCIYVKLCLQERAPRWGFFWFKIGADKQFSLNCQDKV